MITREAYEDWRDAEYAYQVSLADCLPNIKGAGEAADAAFETLSAVAFQQGYDPAGPLGIVEFVMREIAK